MKRKISVASFVNDLSNSQSNFFMIREFNKLDSPFCFYNNISYLVTQANFAVLNSSYLPHYDGNLFCIDPNCALIARKARTNYKIYLYLWDVFFMRGDSDFTYNMDIFRDKSISLICRSESHADAIENYCNRSPLAIIDNWDSEKIQELLT